jgi:carnitine 3-dehydrogenase
MTVGLLGGGVIGGGWAARFLLNGHDVVMYDPDPEASRKVGEVLANARRAFAQLTPEALPPEGTLRIVGTVEEAADGVEFIQESAPERTELKQALLATASRVAGPDVVFGSSTSGLLPTELQRDMVHPERFVVGHPFNPVYLMPLVEICGGNATSAATKQRAAEVYRSIGMKPLLLSKEIDGFVADRLMEALWREALWLINDGVATASEIDDAIRFGPGLRWSFMGTMLVYRIAGGEAGMRHFMAQFGPALQWPWTKLMDVPELTPELLDRICDQSDEQAGGQSIRDLERLRDDCLVGVIRSLQSANFAAGEVLSDYEATLRARQTAGPVPLGWTPVG